MTKLNLLFWSFDLNYVDFMPIFMRQSIGALGWRDFYFPALLAEETPASVLKRGLPRQNWPR